MAVIADGASRRTNYFSYWLAPKSDLTGGQGRGYLVQREGW
jgi:hypothetical protein